MRQQRFNSIAEVLADIQQKLNVPGKPDAILSSSGKLGARVKHECRICRDTEFTFYRDEHGYEVARECACRERKAWKRRFKQSMIPDEFQKANFDNYICEDAIQKQMLERTQQYLKKFHIHTPENSEKQKIIPTQNFGLVASFGEQRLKELPAGERAEMKWKHNNFGIGKTHLQIALAKQLLKQGFRVLVVSDAVFIDDLMHAKRAGDEGEQLNKLLNPALEADVLVWDDMGKSKWTEARETMYYRIINERYRKQMPIVFNSNEDRHTLADKIGYAAASRLIGQCREETGDFLLDAEGQDWRLRKNV